MTAPTPRSANGERGFLLVGVIMFMLALTILGLSLFALSGYEAQFYTASASREQSLQSSESGIEIVKRLLAAPPYRLENAQLAVGQFGVTRALAYQARSGEPGDTTSTGLVNWDSTLVIVVAARSGGEERAIQARFLPRAFKNPYRQLITCGQRIECSGAMNMVGLRGGVWHPVTSSADTAWTGEVIWSVGRPIDGTTPPTPLADAFVDTNLPAAAPPRSSEYQLVDEDSPCFITFRNTNANPTFPSFYLSPPKASSPYEEVGQYSFYTDKPLEIRVRGRVVWVVDWGVCFRHTVKVVPDPAAPDVPGVLVIVSKRSQDPDHINRAIWFQGGLEVVDADLTQLFLVSEGDILVRRERDAGGDQDANALSVVSGGVVKLRGSDSGYDALLAYHAQTMDTIADEFLASGWLPRTNAGSGVSYAFMPGSWLETRLP